MVDKVQIRRGTFGGADVFYSLVVVDGHSLHAAPQASADEALSALLALLAARGLTALELADECIVRP
jgi:hypothetical protein